MTDSASIFDLSQLRSTEDAERVGPWLTPDQFIFLAGARAALLHAQPLVNGSEKVQLITLASVYREALECVPFIVLAELNVRGHGPLICEATNHFTQFPSSPVEENNFAGGHGAQGDPATPKGLRTKETSVGGHEIAPANSFSNAGGASEPRS